MSAIPFSHFRLASRTWNNLIVHHEAMIAQHYLQNHHLHWLVTSLYPPPCWADLRLNYIAGLKYRFSVCSKLAAEMTSDLRLLCLLGMHLEASGVSTDAFPEKELLMKRRSTALLFVIFHFFRKLPREIARS